VSARESGWGKRFRRFAMAGKHRNHRGHGAWPLRPLCPLCRLRRAGQGVGGFPPFFGRLLTRQDTATGARACARSWTAAFQGCQARASITNPVFHALLLLESRWPGRVFFSTIRRPRKPVPPKTVTKRVVVISSAIRWCAVAVVWSGGVVWHGGSLIYRIRILRS
jgi:hypothetical protein